MIPSVTPASHRYPNAAPAAQNADADAATGPEAPADTALISNLPAFAQAPLARLLQGELPEGVTKGELTPADQQEAGKAMFAASMLSTMDEVAGKDEAMGEPGKVVQNGLTCEFVATGMKQIEAILYGRNDASGNPAAMYVKAGADGIQSFGLLDRGTSVEIKGQVMKPVAPQQFEGYVVAGSIPSTPAQ